MPTFAVAGSPAAPATAAAYCSLLTTANRRALLREVGASTTTAVASSIGLGVPANTPTVTTSIVPQAHDVADAVSTTLMITVHGTAPTSPTIFFRKFTLGAAVGAGVIWKLALDERIIMAKTTWFTAWNYGAGTASQVDFYFEYDE